MNPAPLYEEQHKLDAHIIETKGLQGQNLLDKKILALLVELGELANEWRGFKFWSENQNPRTYERISVQGFEDGNILDTYEEKNPLLEEYVDCLHFILSIGSELKIEINYAREEQNNRQDITKIFKSLFIGVGILGNPESDDEINYLNVMSDFIRLGQLLGFTWEQIEQAYMDKNKTNHERQENGY